MGEISFTCRPLTDSKALAPLWRDLEARADAGFFLSWDWIGCWLDSIGVEVLLLEGKAGDKVVALGLLCPGKRAGWGGRESDALFLNQTGDPESDRITIEYNGLLLDREIAAGGAAQALAVLFTNRCPHWDELFLRGLAPSFAAAVEAGDFPARLRSRRPTARVDLAALRKSGQAYLDARSANTRSQIRRAIRRYEQRGPLRLEAAAGVAEAHGFFDELGKLHQEYWTGKGRDGAFASDFFVVFHRRLIERCLPNGGVEVLRLSAGGQAVGYLYNFIRNRTVYYYASGFRYETDNRLKPGLVAHTLCVERHLAGGMDRYDFLAGEARYKASLGEPGPELRDYLLERPGAKLAVKRTLRWLRDRGPGTC